MKKQSGFTLIELMVVMAIIAILTTAGLSAYS
ncbi:MAG: prepilin-type N-terminal cleavage/methylation domain-containing protein [bacterium]